MGMDQQMYSHMMDRNMMDHDMMGRNMMSHDMTGRNMNGLMGRRNIYNINQDSGMMRQQMSSNKSGRDMSSNMMYNNMLRDRDMTSNMMGQMDTFTTEGMMGQQQHMSQQMEMSPETY